MASSRSIFYSSVPKSRRTVTLTATKRDRDWQTKFNIHSKSLRNKRKFLPPVCQKAALRDVNFTGAKSDSLQGMFLKKRTVFFQVYIDTR